ncbi:MAG: PEP/pyruvate-binding domain-containing protein [Bradymonadaceae bacterium]
MSETVETDLTVPLGVGELPRDRVGGKASGLNRLMGAGFRVPPGFCVTVDAFEQVIDACVGRAQTLDGLRSELREAPLPIDLVRAVRRHVERIGAARWAVRSSAVEEDTEQYSFAGQQRTELDVEGVDGILDAVRRVWADLYDLDALLYRARLRVDAVPSPMAVLVQAMVEPSVGGVMFTENPLAGDDRQRREALITASIDSGVSVVEGRGGDSYFVDRSTGTIRRALGDQHGTEAATGSLTDGQVRTLIEVGSEVEGLFGRPRDIEWAYGTPSWEATDGQSALYLLQARAITGGPSADVDEGDVWSNVNVGEALPGVGTPLTWSIIGKFSRRGFERAFGTLGLSVPEEVDLVGSFRGRVYLNLTEFVSIASGIPILDPEVLFQMGGGGGVDLVQEDARDQSPVEFLSHLPITIPRILGSQLIMPLVAWLWSRFFDGRLQAFFGRDLDDETLGELAAELDGIDWLFDRTGLIMLACSSNFLMSYVIMKKYLDWFGRQQVRRRERTLFGALDVQSAEPVMDLLELTRLADRSDSVASAISEKSPDQVLPELERMARHGDGGASEFLKAFEAFRREHGHRAPREAELATPRWREESRFIFEVVESYLEADDVPTPEAYRRSWAEERREVDQLVGEGFGSLVEPWFRLVLQWARATARIREFMRSHVVETLDMYRRFALECGRRLERIGRLKDAEDVFYLRHDELTIWLHGEADAAGMIREFPLRTMVRKALVEGLRSLPDPPNTFVLQDGEMIDEESLRQRDETAGAEPEDVRTVLDGLAGAPGRVTGPARVIEDPESGETVETGEILVAPYTDVGWTPLFMTASAIVMGLGGPLSHACIVAREFDIPTVVNAHGASDVIQTGDRITVDGSAGRVYIHRGAGGVKQR